MIARSKHNPSGGSALIEMLETRRLLSAAPEGTAVLHGGELTVTGTRNADLIAVSINHDMVDVKLNDSVIGSFALSDVTQRIHIRAGKGDDTVYVDESGGLFPVAFVIHGEQGNDTLVGSAGDDLIYGGVGSDVLYGNDGHDELFGDNGKDLLVGGFGDDTLEGGNGCDTLYGELGADTLRGGNGKDILDGSDDNDHLDGGRGFDQLTGGLGVDTFAGSDKTEEILDKADEDVHVVATPGKGGSKHN